MGTLPPSIQNLINEFNKLPGIGPKTSERFIFHLLKRPKSDLEQMANSLRELKDKIAICTECYDFTENSPCDICTSSQRDKTTICVVAESPDLMAIEKAGTYKGIYHVLGGVINQIYGIGPDQLRINELEERIKKNGIKEIILATNPDMEGESTALYLIRVLKPLGIRITRIGKGLPMGSNIEYADEVTLANAMEGRGEVK
ncbi:recombination mediator RecR [Patescibacteria group bacterium]|nr:recombination mediator RecR [Patescibacteria group bacterium]MBU1075327.1 recombination mediator RecR [Patescibacteria group bacterium]MBU1951421.1 recombination mediator RecR [Patescibacteria group bacterium]MBU2229182.1 recombination mediator RecR [Patescibacteria group bacterium]MBU2235653.1 recombination mediator RecR [Patescibacteria group bacterium]